MTEYRVPAFCKLCGRRPPFRAFAEMVKWARGLEPETPVLSLPCPDEDCDNDFVTVTAFDLQRATPVRKAA